MYTQTILEVLQKQNKMTPTLIQKRTYDAIKNGASVIGLAKTGTGKTLAYSLPALENIKPDHKNSLIIFEPTTELAIQTRNAILPFVKALQLNTIALVGAGNRSRQIEQLKKKRPEVLVVTPGRFFDLFSNNKIKLNQIETLIIDEADDILEFAKLDLLESLGQNLLPTSQVLLFGATQSQITKEAEKIFARHFLLIDVRPDQTSKVEHGFLQVSNRYKNEFLQRLVKVDGFKGILFFDSNYTLEKFASIFVHSKTKFSILTTAQNKEKNSQVLKQLDDGKIRLLLATDLAARGLDIKDLTYVVNYELPEDKNTYLHRSGRTGRMGNEGHVITIGDDHDFRDLKKLISPIKLEKVYFEGFHLTTKFPKKKQDKVVVKKREHHNKKRRRNQKNKGYHPKHKSGGQN